MKIAEHFVSCHALASLLALLPSLAVGTEFSFERVYVDVEYGGNGKPGWVRAGDMDGDGDSDIVAGGGYALFIYENAGNATGWTRYGNLDSTNQMGANGAVLHDVDKDGDLDVVSAKYNAALGWWQNPGGPLSNDLWKFHELYGSFKGWFTHDMIRRDLDQDGEAEEFIVALQKGYWDAPFHVYWFRPAFDPSQHWEKYVITHGQAGPNNSHAGLDTGDIDGDGDIDISFSNGWFESSGDPMGNSIWSTVVSNWTWHKITDIYGISNSLIRDLDDDGDQDLVLSGGHHGQGVYWFENTGQPGNGSWVMHSISRYVENIHERHKYNPEAGEHLHHPECLAVLDLDYDSDRDVISCDLFFGEDPGEPSWSSEVHNVYVFENLGDGRSWDKQNIAPNSYPSHQLQATDINDDGMIDIISESAGYSVISYYQNTSRAEAADTFLDYPPQKGLGGQAKR